MEVHTHQHDYKIIMQRGILSRARNAISSDSSVYLISDDGVPQKWRDALWKQYPGAFMKVIPHGEASKNMNTLQDILAGMLSSSLSRKDLVIALGGGVVGDISGLASSLYMRGIRYVNIPTTMLAMVDSSIGGKTAVDFCGVKNSVGTFWQPSMVLIDPDVLSTLSPRLVSEGMAEAVKSGLIGDEKLFELFERDDYMDHIEEIIERSLLVKKKIVEADEREGGVRKLLNFGHTYGHAYESCSGLGTYLHGECVAMGMMTVLKNEEIKKRLSLVLERLHLPQHCDCSIEEVCALIQKDKKAEHGHITIVQVDEIGKGHLENWSMQQIREKAQI